MKTEEEIKEMLELATGELEFRHKKFIDEASERMPSIIKLTELNSKCDKLQSRITALKEVLGI